MSVKLSELLDRGAIGLAVWAEGCREQGLNAAERMHLDEQEALRAIAPALVEAIQATHVALTTEYDDESWHDPEFSRRPAKAMSALLVALQEAGVTCE